MLAPEQLTRPRRSNLSRIRRLGRPTLASPMENETKSQFVSDVQMTKLYVGNLPFTATEEGVRTLFAAHGNVDKVSLITDRDTGRPRGFGFVEMSNADASRAMQALNGKDFEGRALKVNEAQDRDRSGGGSRGGPRRY